MEITEVSQGRVVAVAHQELTVQEDEKTGSRSPLNVGGFVRLDNFAGFKYGEKVKVTIIVERSE